MRGCVCVSLTRLESTPLPLQYTSREESTIGDQERQSEQGDLGTLLSEHRAPASLGRIAWLSGPVCLAVGAVAVGGAFSPDPGMTWGLRVFALLLGAAVGGLGVLVFALWRRKRVTLVQLCSGGLVEQVGTRRRQLLWRDVTQARYVPLGYVSELRLELRDGSRLRFNSQHLEGLHAIALCAERELTARSLPELRAGLQTDESLSFGKVRASRRGIQYGRRLLGWDEIASASARLGFLEVLKHGDALPSLRIRLTRLERVPQLLALMRERRQTCAMSAPLVTSSAFGQVRRLLWLHSLLLAPLMLASLGLAGYGLFHGLHALAAVPEPPRAASPWPDLVWALLGGCLAVFGAFGWWHDVSLGVRRQRLARRLAPTGKLLPVLVLEDRYEEWSLRAGFRYRYITPAGYEATDKLDAQSGGPEPWPRGSGYLLALCSADERESVLISASGYPLARLPGVGDATSNA
jgi:hypothetical protein